MPVDLQELIDELTVAKLHSDVAQVLISLQLISLLGGGVVLKLKEKLWVIVLLLHICRRFLPGQRLGKGVHKLGTHLRSA